MIENINRKKDLNVAIDELKPQYKEHFAKFQPTEDTQSLNGSTIFFSAASIHTPKWRIDSRNRNSELKCSDLVVIFISSIDQGLFTNDVTL